MSWLDWSGLDKHADIHRFVKLLIERRLLRSVDHELQRISLSELLNRAAKAWHGVKLFAPDWSDHSHSVALGAELRKEALQLHFILNAYWELLDFELPKLEGNKLWRRWIDTGLDSPHDIAPWQTAPAVSGAKYRVEHRSVAILFA